jgi:hypothetical protein
MPQPARASQRASNGWTSAADFRLIQALALRTGGEYYRAYRAADLPQVFTRIVDGLSQLSRGAEAPPSTPPPSEPAPSASVLPPPVAAAPPRGLSPGDLALIPLVVLLLGAAGFLAWRYARRPAVEEPAPAPAGLAPPTAQLVDVHRLISSDPLALRLEDGPASVGRDPASDVFLENGRVSSLHASIERRDGFFLLTDRRSTNGTRLNGQRLDPNRPVEIKAGDQIHFADLEFRFQVPDHIPAGQTVIVPVTAWAQKDESELRLTSEPEGEPPAAPHVDDFALFRECLSAHLERIRELGPVYQRFVDRAFTPDLEEGLAASARELMKQASSAHDLRRREYPTGGVLFVLCVIPDSMDRAAGWFSKEFGGFSNLLTAQLESESFRRHQCRVLCVVTYGRSEGAWVSMTIATAQGYPEPIDLLSYEFLNEEEQRRLAPAYARAVQSSRSGSQGGGSSRN